MLCGRCRELLFADGVSISLASTSGLMASCVTGDEIASFEEIEFLLGEGPSLEAHHRGQAVYSSHRASDRLARWPALSTATDHFGAWGVYAFPLKVGAARIGVLSLYDEAPSDPSSGALSDAIIVADVVSHVVLSMQGNMPLGEIAMSFKENGAFRAEIHQASGMLAEQIGCGVADALVQLRSRAYATERPVADLAIDVIAGRLRLVRSEDHDIEWSEGE